jgi:hypothetical protein
MKFLIFLLFINIAFANTDKTNLFTLGTVGASTYEKKIQFRDGGALKYNPSTAKVQFSHNGTDFSDMGSGSGNGSTISYVTNYNLEADAVGYFGFADVGGFVDGTSGSLSTFTFSRNTTTPLDGLGDLKFSTSGSCLGQGVSVPFTIPKTMKAKALTMQFNKDASSALYGDGDLETHVFDIGGNREIAITDPTIYGGNTDYKSQFQTSPAGSNDNADGSANYRLSIMCKQTAAEAFTVYADNISVSQGKNVSGYSGNDLRAYTPATRFTGGTTAGLWRKTGDSIDLEFRIAFSGALGGNPFFSLPSGMSFDATKLIAGGGNIPLLSCSLYDATGSIYHGVGTYADTTSFLLKRLLATATTSSNVAYDVISSVAPFTWANNDYIWCVSNKSIPITGFSSNTIQSDDSAQRLVSVFGNGNAGQAIVSLTTPIPFITISDSHGAWSGSVFTAPTTGFFSAVGAYKLTTSIDTPTKAYINNGTSIKLISGDGAASTRHAFSGRFKLNKGDTLDIRTGSAATLSNDTTDHWITITKDGDPTTISSTETISSLYKGAPPTGTLTTAYNLTTFGTKVLDTTNGYASGSYLVSTGGNYDISSMVALSGTRVLNTREGIAIYIDGAIAYNQELYSGGASTYAFLNIDVKSVPLVKGQTVDVRVYSGATGAAYLSNAYQNWFSIKRNGL